MKEFKFMVVTPEDNYKRLLTVRARTLQYAIHRFFIRMLITDDVGVFQELLTSEKFYAVEGDTTHEAEDLIKAFAEE
jgi:hypothetical protein